MLNAATGGVWWVFLHRMANHVDFLIKRSHIQYFRQKQPALYLAIIFLIA
jgi:hypothetical protein